MTNKKGLKTKSNQLSKPFCKFVDLFSPYFLIG